MDEICLFQHLEGLEKTDLLQFLKSCYEDMTIQARYRVFWETYQPLPPLPIVGEELKKQVDQFDKDSRDGHYYHQIVTTARNYDQVPEETEIWYDRLDLLLQKSILLTDQGDYPLAFQCFQILDQLMEDALTHVEEIIFDEGPGLWNISVREDTWQAAFQKAEAHVVRSKPLS